MISPGFDNGANTAERVPITTGAAPERASRHARSRSWSVSDECSTASGASKRAANRDTSCGVSAISGTSTSACSLRATTASMALR